MIMIGKEKIANWYKKGLWDKDQVAEAVLGGEIAEEDYAEITGEVYTGAMGLGEYKAFYEAAKEILPEGSEG
jgi:hypothetical protein